MTAEATLEQRDVLVIMPFGGEKNVENRRAVLNFKRLEHLIKMCEVKNVDSQVEISYTVRACKVCNGNDFNDTILERIRNADIVIAIFNTLSATVVYEAAVRHLMRDGLILVVDSAQPEVLPYYLRSTGYCPWAHESAKAVIDRIDQIANDLAVPELDDFDADIPKDLATVIREDDEQLRKSLETALKQIDENTVQPRPPFVRAVAGGMLGGIIADRMTALYSPISVVAVAFKNSGTVDNKRPPIVCEFNDAFARLYGYPDYKAAEQQKPLTADKLLVRLHENKLVENSEEFEADQARLTAIIIYDKGTGWAKVPMDLSRNHPSREFQNRKLIPCVVARQTVGNVNGRHTMYLLVNYIDVTELTSDILDVADKMREVPNEVA